MITPGFIFWFSSEPGLAGATLYTNTHVTSVNTNSHFHLNNLNNLNLKAMEGKYFI